MKSNHVAQEALEGLHLLVRRLPEAKGLGERADFIATLEQIKVLVTTQFCGNGPEVFTQTNSGHDETWNLGVSSQFAAGTEICRAIRHGVKQLKAEWTESHDFKVLLYLTDGLNASIACEQIIDALYGTTSLLRSVPGVTGLKEMACYFCRENEFYLARSLDAAIVGFRSGESWELKLCLNPLSLRFEALRTSVLAQVFGGRTMDPAAEESRGDALLPDLDVVQSLKERKSYERAFSVADEMLRHLEEKYGYPPLTLLQGKLNKMPIIRHTPR